MVSKKFKLILALLGLIQTASFSQATDANWVYDSSKISSKNMPHYNEFTNYQTPYPAKPRSMWELGVSGGLSMILGDIDPQGGLGGGLSIRKALGHVVSIRAGWNGSVNEGLDYRLRKDVSGGAVPNPWQHYTEFNQDGGQYVANYRNILHQLSLEALFSLNTISHYRGNPKWDWYFLAGYTVISADVDVHNGGDGSGNFINWSTITDYRKPRGDIKDDLKNNAGLDAGLFDFGEGTYNANAPVENGSRSSIGTHDGNEIRRHGLNVGGGFAFKLSSKINLGIEEKLTIPFDDNMDGVSAGTTKDLISATQFRLNFNMGNSSKKVEPLWWINPFNYLYNEVATPRHMKLPPVVLPDADGDGVTDQFDMEPNTPAGCAVDTHGVSLDTDGDGVPDCRDKEKLTPQNCFPVNSDGVGSCPPDTCCNRPNPTGCNLGSFPSIQFSSGSSALSSTAKSLLDDVAAQLTANPNCQVQIIGYGKENKPKDPASARVTAVKNYLSEQKNISETRIQINIMKPSEGSSSTVDLVPVSQ